MTGWHAYDVLVSTGCDAILAVAILAGLWLVHRAGMCRVRALSAREEARSIRPDPVVCWHERETDEARRHPSWSALSEEAEAWLHERRVR